MKKTNLIFAIINTLLLLYCILALVFHFSIMGIILTVASIAFSIFLVLLIIHLFKKKKTVGNIVMIILSIIIFIVTFAGFVYDGIVSYINGSFHEIMPSFVVAIYIIFSLFSWGMVLHLKNIK